LVVLGALAVSLFFHSPRLWILLGPPVADATYWARGLQFSLQCEQPFGSAVLDQGLIWRLAPALLGHVLHLRGSATFAIPWAGLVMLLALTAALAWRLTRDLRSTALFTALIGTTTATLTVTGWLGMNDAWYASALLIVAVQPQTGWLVVAGLIGPWIDERFVLGLPLACYVHAQICGIARLKHLIGVVATGVALYLGIRLANPLGLPAQRVSDYLTYSLTHFHEWLPWTTLGWFMGLRAAWLLVLGPLIGLAAQRHYRHALLLAALIFLPLLVITLVSSDTSRAPTMLLPLLFLGLAQGAGRWPPTTLQRILTGLLAANLLMPAMHVTYKYSDIINLLPVEIARFFAH
jgi:hypothetical protein